MQEKDGYVVLQIENLHCAACALDLEDEIRKIKGVEEVQVDFLTQTIRLKASEEGILKTIKTANKFENVRVKNGDRYEKKRKLPQKELLLILKKLFTSFGISTFASELGLTFSGAIIMILAIVIMVLLDRKLTLPEYTSPSGAKMLGGTSMYILWAILLAWLLLLASNGSSAFIYFQF